MNRFHFALRNVRDKLYKGFSKPDTFPFYFRTYLLARLDRSPVHASVVSYPKCGRTWLRVMLLEYLDSLDMPRGEFLDAGKIQLPEGRVLRFDHHKAGWVPAPKATPPNVPDLENYQNRMVIFLVRDPRDVLVSSYYHLRFRENIYQDDLATFIRDPLVGAEKVARFMQIWLQAGERLSQFLLMRYEDLHADGAQELRRLLAFLELPVEEEKVLAAVENASFKRMKKREQSGDLKEPWMRSGSPGSEHAMKVRKGKVGSFREECSQEDIAYLDRVIEAHLPAYLRY